jgi:membrane protease YdiL (CAAX protease family)
VFNLFVIVILGLMLYDWRILMGWNAEQCRFYFHLPPGIVGSVFIVLISSPLWGWDDPSLLQRVIFMVLIVPYWVCRQACLTKNRLSSGGSSPRLGHSRDSMLRALGVILAWFMIMEIIGLVMLVMTRFNREAFSPLELALLVTVLSTVALLWLILRAEKAESWEDCLRRLNFYPDQIPVRKKMVLPVIVGAGLAFLGAWINSMRERPPVTPMSQMVADETRPGLFLILLVMALVVAPFVEELIYRGFFFKRFREWLGTRWTIFWITVIFACLHVSQYWGDPLAIGIVSLLSLILTGMRWWTGSVFPSVVMHYAYNVGFSVAVFVFVFVRNPALLEYQAGVDLAVDRKIELLRQALSVDPHLYELRYDLARLYLKERDDPAQALTWITIEEEQRAVTSQEAILKAEVLDRLGNTAAACDIVGALQSKQLGGALESERKRLFDEWGCSGPEEEPAVIQ